MKCFSRLAALSFPLLAACSETTVEVELRSLQASSEVAFVCRTGSGEGIDRSQCPDYDDDESTRRLYALVTQTSTEEVAVIDATDPHVVDVDPSVPGFSFLRVPSRPGDIVSTPGGAASIVGLTGVGTTGLTAIPTTCIGPPGPGETVRDVTSFPSCRLPTAPGDMAILLDPPRADGAVHTACGSDGIPEGDTPEAATRDECAADVTREHLDENGNVVGPLGRRKLAVSLPDFGQIAIVDVQELLDRTPGSFQNCRIEATLDLSVELGPSGTKQELPSELENDCELDQPVTPPAPPSYASRPGGFAAADNRLYVADREAPVVHVVDASDPCAMTELLPLLPMSLLEPNRIVTTSRVAASPLTPAGRRFVYAIDEFDQPSASLMVFDVSPGSTNRTPLVRPGSLRIPEPPDRLQLGTPIADVTFALRDLPVPHPDTGVAETGVHCDPYPDLDGNGVADERDRLLPAAQHRPTADQTRGAQPRLLRGLFGLAMLTSGHVAIIDVDDFDAPCRRPRTVNPDENEDFRGCSGDRVPEGQEGPYFYTHNGEETGSPTVTDETSCRMVQPHRFRSATFGLSSASEGVGTASLVSLPEFVHELEEPQPQRPKLLAVPFEGVDGGEPAKARVYIGSTLYEVDQAGADLVTDPNQAQVPSLTLPFVEPRAYPASEAVVLAYEGSLTGVFPNGRFELEEETLSLVDGNAGFCDAGVYDREMMAEYGVEELGVSSEGSELFAREHADFVEVTSELLPVTDSYWVSARALGEECRVSYNVCLDTFGRYDELEPNPNREFSVVEAFQDELVVEASAAELGPDAARRFRCCFPQGVQYRVRAKKQWILSSSAGSRHDVVPSRVTTTRFECERSCDPRKKFSRNRVFEIASETSCLGVEGDPRCSVGLGVPGVDPCVYDACVEVGAGGTCTRAEGISPSEPAAACIHAGLTSRFAVYRGLSPSVRGMAFRWQTTGGFRTLLTSLASVSLAVMPQHIEYVPELQRIAIVDGASLGLSLVSIDTLRVEEPWPVY